MAKLFRQHGEQPPPELASSLYVIGDGDGQPHRALGLPKNFHQPFALLLDRHGGELARGPLAASAPTIARAMATQSP
jgi:hypothetical protein